MSKQEIEMKNKSEFRERGMKDNKDERMDILRLTALVLSEDIVEVALQLLEEKASILHTQLHHSDFAEVDEAEGSQTDVKRCASLLSPRRRRMIHI